MFSIHAQVLGSERSARAEADGTGIVVMTTEGPRRASSWTEALNIARDYIGEFLRPAQRPGVPWGVRVSVPDGQAVYGEWPLTGGGRSSPSFERTPLAQIRDRWEGSSAISALQNAVAIVRAYIPRRRAAA
jgi:hypothetical protein